MKMAGVRVCGCVFAMSYCCFMLLAVAQTTHLSEVTALRAVKRSLHDPMKHLRNWKMGDPCTSNWTGVICFDAVQNDGYLHVQKLQLLNKNLSGSLAPELGQLSHLEILDFMWNEITYSVPKEIGNITSLKLLLLNGNKLSGPLPEELGYLSNLDRLQVDENNISGPIPKSFGHLRKLTHLHMNNNSISGQIPSELSNLSSVIHVTLESNHLSGPLPQEFSNLPELRLLQLDNNNFEGTVPDSYGNLSKLVKLSLRNCNLHGAVPDLSRILRLSYLDLGFNRLSGSIPSNKLSINITTIDMSDNYLTGSIPRSFSDLPRLQRLSLENNLLTGSVLASIWNMFFNTTAARLKLDLRNNKLANILGDLNPPPNVTLSLQGNPICKNENIQNKGQFCGPKAGGDGMPESSTNSTPGCPDNSCPVDASFEYVPASCFCALPLKIGYRLQSPSFSHFSPYRHSFEMYLTRSLYLSLNQLSIDSIVWEEGHRLRMYLKLFPMDIIGSNHHSLFNTSEIQRIKGMFTSWDIPNDDFFGPYEVLNFTLLGPYLNATVETQKTSISKGIWAAIILGASACAIMASVLVTLLIARRHDAYRHNLSRKNLSLISKKIDGVKSFTFREMALATENFNISTQVGRGGYGRVYKGILSDNTIVAIKRAGGGSIQGQKEFFTEIELLSRLHHRNLVSLVGYCDEEGEQMLVYEFMHNGSLQYWLSATAKEGLNFVMRARIALGSAKGILYLHTEAQPPVFHRDIKASNILLDSNLTAKVADFGLSKLAPVFDDEGAVPDHVSTVVKGTPGYLDPEYFMTHKLTDKSDVYSLGVVFLELLTGMQPVSRGKNIVREVNIAYQSGMIFSIIDSRMGPYPSKCVERFVALALSCCQDKTEQRPSMLDVVRELENILGLMSVTDTKLSEGAHVHSGMSASSSLPHMSRDVYVSSSDLRSDVIPIIAPR